MRILHIYKDYCPVLGGVENHIRALARGQAAHGHRVTVLVCDSGAKPEACAEDGVEVMRARRLFTAQSMPISISQPMIAARLPADVVHVHSPYPLGEVSAWLFRSDALRVITHHSDILRQRAALCLYAPVLRRVLAACDRIIATSERYVETSPWLRPVRHKCEVVPLGVDLQVFKPPRQPFAGPPTLLFVGKLRYYKGLDILLQALQRLPGVRLRIVGDGPMRASLETSAGALGVQGRVVFTGEVDARELPGLYQQAHVFVLPSTERAEAFGTVLLEAMAAGLPCVTTEIGTGTSWVVRDGVTGCVVAPRDAGALAAAIGGLLADPQAISAMRSAARYRVETEFSAQRMLEGTLQVYGELIEGDRRRAGIGEGEA